MNISGPRAPSSTALRAASNRRVIPVIEPDTDEPPVRAGGGDQPIDFCDRPRGGLLDEDVLAGFERADRDWRQRVVGGRHNDDVHIVCRRRILPAVERPGARSIRASARGAIGHGVGNDREGGARQRSSALTADQAASDNRDPRQGSQRSPQVRPRSFGTMRRSV